MPTDSTSEKCRCAWAGELPLYQHYHDTEWGVPLHDDDRLFEFLLLEGAQAGLSWITILRKRENYRAAFDGFDATRIANYGAPKIESLLQDSGIVRNQLKINAAITNAQRFIEIQHKYGSFSNFIWQFVNHQTIQNNWETMVEVPANTAQSDKMCQTLKQRGFKFVGSNNLLCFHASNRYGQRSHYQLFSARTTGRRLKAIKNDFKIHQDAWRR